ncbi:uncharacterized protein K452DRAFT_252116 [Aplosporella prunicola CBS 121167]|uniref:Heterokaryon incompatibility domain-containing protein n=1 Tax=Aplosporella prunicola CBS 121167 TaxID=1176127 RepID=A0A6A6B923_9PEZI|nr:uncharacterized protein K452DRAFT_252116 [Aplosporella prunicola CBS 121167]KAF2140466.1 hypothetical protein K452DRAFT_252116 [Aplosporella prunicola CBS 121167]
MEDQAYHYQSLPGPRYIRLLELLPGPPEARISVVLQDCLLDTAPAYDAISYVWGDPTAREEINCGDGRVSITRSLHDALRRFRREQEPRLLWADAICINQGDLAERAQQVQIMDCVYKSARVCLIWLGPSDEDTDVAMQLMRDISAEVCKRKGIAPEDLEREFDENGRDMLQAKHIGFNNLPPPNSPLWVSLGRLFKRKWFSRMWVLQEAHFARAVKVYCGAAQTTWAPVHHAADWFLTNSYDLNIETFWFVRKRDSDAQNPNYGTEERYGNVIGMRGYHLNNPQRLSVLSLLSEGHNFDATDSRDKIYALIHFDAFQHVLPGLRVDYTQPFQALYMDVAFKAMQRTKSVALLSHTRRDPDDDGDDSLPSWVPSWHKKKRKSHGSVLFGSDHDPLFHANGSRPLTSITRLGPDGRGIRLQGLTLATVVDVCDIVSWHMDTPDRLRKPIFTPHAPWTPYDVTAANAAYPSKEDVVMAYALTLTSGGIENQAVLALRCPASGMGPQRAEFVAWLQHLREEPDPTSPPGMYSDSRPRLDDDVEEAARMEMWVRYQGMARAYCAHRCLFRTDGRAWLGLGAKGVRSGDRVVLLRGGAAPVVLRERVREGVGEGEEGVREGGYVLVGDAYVHGVMDGEGWEGFAEGDGEGERREECFDVF